MVDQYHDGFHIFSFSNTPRGPNIYYDVDIFTFTLIPCNFHNFNLIFKNQTWYKSPSTHALYSDHFFIIKNISINAIA